MKKRLLLISFLVTFCFAQGQNLVTENFDVFPTTWTKINASVPAGTNIWGAATASQLPLFGGGTGAYNGTAATSYAFANFQSTTGNNTISNWFITPAISLMDGDVISFYSSKGLSGGTDVFPDNLELRISTNGTASVNPVGPLGVGDFTTLAIAINPTLSPSGYPNTWTQYTYTVTGIPTITSCKVAFRYFVTNGGPSGTNSDQVGIDQYSIDRPVANTTDFFTSNFSMYPNPVAAILNITSKYGIAIETVQVFDINGRMINQIKTSIPESVQIDVLNLNSGVYFVKVQSELGVGTSKFIKN